VKKLFLSADMEGTCGVTHWEETERGKLDYEHFRAQMSREVAAACEGALAAGFEDVLVKDAHDYCRNIWPELLPEQARILRANAKHLYIMMAGLDASFDGVVFTGYHSAAEMPTNPLSHTMNTRNVRVTLNGELCSELLLNSLTAAMLGVPVYCVTGDKGLCDWVQSINPNIVTVPVSEGMGNASLSIHPKLAVSRIREAVERAVKQPKEACMFPMPDHFVMEICFKQHYDALGGSWYPGAKQVDARTVRFESDCYEDVLRFVYFVL
jgi:D-amino peptidase